MERGDYVLALVLVGILNLKKGCVALVTNHENQIDFGEFVGIAKNGIFFFLNDIPLRRQRIWILGEILYQLHL